MNKELIIKQNVSRVIPLNNEVCIGGITVSLVNNHGARVATYKFNIGKIRNRVYIKSFSDNSRIRFNIEPSYSSEIVSGF